MFVHSVRLVIALGLLAAAPAYARQDPYDICVQIVSMTLTCTDTDLYETLDDLDECQDYLSHAAPACYDLLEQFADCIDPLSCDEGTSACAELEARLEQECPDLPH